MTARRWGVSLLFAFVACVEPASVQDSQVVAVVYSDPQLEPMLDRITVEVRDDQGKRAVDEHAFALSKQITLPLSFGIVQPNGGAEWFMLVTRGYDSDGTLLVQHEVIAQFEARKKGLLQVYLGIACLRELCAGHPEQTCQGETGTCTDIERVRPEASGADAAAPVLHEDAHDAAAVPDAGPLDEGRGVAPVGATFGSLGGRRSDGALTVYDDGFEGVHRMCTRDGMFCAMGSFGP